MSLMKKHLDSELTAGLESNDGLDGYKLVVSGKVDDFYEDILRVIDSVESIQFKDCVFQTDQELLRVIEVLVSNSIRDLCFDSCVFEESVLSITNNSYVKFLKKIEVLNTKLDLGLVIILNSLTQEAGIEFLYTENKALYDLSYYSWEQLGGISLPKDILEFRLGLVLPYSTYFNGCAGLERFLEKNSHLRSLIFGSDLEFGEFQDVLKKVLLMGGALKKLSFPAYNFTFSDKELGLIEDVLSKGVELFVAPDQYDLLSPRLSDENRVRLLSS
jgi:hypothetical protein